MPPKRKINLDDLDDSEFNRIADEFIKNAMNQDNSDESEEDNEMDSISNIIEKCRLKNKQKEEERKKEVKKEKKKSKSVAVELPNEEDNLEISVLKNVEMLSKKLKETKKERSIITKPIKLNKISNNIEKVEVSGIELVRLNNINGKKHSNSANDFLNKQKLKINEKTKRVSIINKLN